MLMLPIPGQFQIKKCDDLYEITIDDKGTYATPDNQVHAQEGQMLRWKLTPLPGEGHNIYTYAFLLLP